MSGAEAASSYDLELVPDAPFAFLVRLPPAVRNALATASKASNPLGIRFGTGHKDGAISVSGQEYQFRCQSTSDCRAICHPKADEGDAIEVGSVMHKCTVQVVAKAKTVTIGKSAPKSKGSSLAAKAALLEEEEQAKTKEREERKRQQQSDLISAKAQVGKTTAPQKFRFSAKQAQPVLLTSSLPAPPALAGASRATPPPPQTGAVPVPKVPTQEMLHAAAYDGLRACIVALLLPEGMKTTAKKLEGLVTATFREVGKAVPTVRAIHDERQKVAEFRPPGAYLLKGEVREQLASKAARPAKSPETSPDPPARLMVEKAPGTAGSSQDDRGSEGKSGGRKRVLRPAGSKVWNPMGDAASRLAAVPSTAAAERAEKERKQSVLTARDDPDHFPEAAEVGAVDPLPMKPKKLSKKKREVSGHPGDATANDETPRSKKRLRSKDGPGEPKDVVARALARTNSRMPEEPGGSTAPEAEWFFREHLHRPPRTYEAVTSQEQADNYHEEYQAKYPVLERLNREIDILKHQVKHQGKRGREEAVKELWQSKGRYLTSMDSAFRILNKELASIKQQAKPFLRQLKARRRKGL